MPASTVEIKRTVQQWNTVRARLKKEFAAKQITFCEKCGSTFNLRFSHRMKRRHITTMNELRTCALLCEICDVELEYSPNLYAEITEIIENRKEIWTEPA